MVDISKGIHMVIFMDETLLRGFHAVMKLRPFMTAAFHRVKNILHSMKCIASHREVESDLSFQMGLFLRFVNTVQFLSATNVVPLIVSQALVRLVSRGKRGLWFWYVSTLQPTRHAILRRNIRQDTHVNNSRAATYGILSIREKIHVLKK